jgi:hypothetical protein
MKAKGKRQKAKIKRSALFLFSEKAAQSSEFPFAF